MKIQGLGNITYCRGGPAVINPKGMMSDWDWLAVAPVSCRVLAIAWWWLF
jgi:hypothetical protein